MYDELRWTITMIEDGLMYDLVYVGSFFEARAWSKTLTGEFVKISPRLED